MTVIDPGRGEVARAAPDPHQRLFTSGAYVAAFQPESGTNPFRRLYEAKRRAVVGSVPGEGLRVLDIGAGPGRMSVELAARHRVVVCDLSVAMLARARDRGGALPLTVCAADAARPPFRAGEFDRVLCIDVLPHLTDPVAALRELRALLAPGGRLVVDSTNALPLWTLAYPRYLGRRPARWVRTWRSGGVPPEWSSRVHHYRAAAFRRMLAAAGLDVIEMQRFGPGPATKWHLATTAAQ